MSHGPEHPVANRLPERGKEFGKLACTRGIGYGKVLTSALVPDTVARFHQGFR